MNETMLLDTFQAFDILSKMYRLLVSKCICPMGTTHLRSMSTTHKLRIRKRSINSCSFGIENGVKQSGDLFRIWLLLFSFADYCTLLKPTISNLSKF